MEKSISKFLYKTKNIYSTRYKVIYIQLYILYNYTFNLFINFIDIFEHFFFL